MMGGHRRILVVEDDPETAGQLVDSLTTSGYQVDLAATITLMCDASGNLPLCF